MNAPYRAQPGRQRDFCSSPADIAIYGGAAGGGKSFALLLEAAKWAHVSGYRAAIYRRQATDIMAEGGLWDEAQEMYSALGGHFRESPRATCTFPSGARVGFDHLQHEKTKQRKQGLQLAFLGFDELTHFTEGQFWYLVGRLRSTSGVRPYCRATCNPDPDSFVRQLIDWWIGRDGLPIMERGGKLRWFVRMLGRLYWADTPEELQSKFPGSRPKSLTFIPAKLADNPALTDADPDYESNLDAQTLVDRARLKDGNWDIREIAGNFFRRSWFDVVDEIPSDVVRWVRTWDLAGSDPTEAKPDPDWTRGVRMGITKPRADGRRRLVIADVASLRSTPGSVEALYQAVAKQDGKNVSVGFWQDPAQAGKFQAEYFQRALRGYHVETVVASQDKTAYAKLWSPLAEPKKDEGPFGDVIIVRGQWNEAFFNEAEAFPEETAHNDIIDAVSRGALMLIKPPAQRAKWRTVKGI